MDGRPVYLESRFLRFLSRRDVFPVSRTTFHIYPITSSTKSFCHRNCRLYFTQYIGYKIQTQYECRAFGKLYTCHKRIGVQSTASTLNYSHYAESQIDGMADGKQAAWTNCHHTNDSDYVLCLLYGLEPADTELSLHTVLSPTFMPPLLLSGTTAWSLYRGARRAYI